MSDNLSVVETLSGVSLNNVNIQDNPNVKLDYTFIDRSNYEFEDYAEFYFGQRIFENQKAIIGALTNTGATEVDVYQPRQTGKTSSVAISCALLMDKYGSEWNKYNPEPYRIGIFGPKLAQSQLDVQRLKSWGNFNPNGRKLINWGKSSSERITWWNGSEVHAMSASEQTESEGYTYNVVITEESQKISDHVVSQVILPMLGATGGKLVKIGTVRATRNHFWRSCTQNPRSIKVAHHWLSCGILLRNGFKQHNGRMISDFMLSKMPWILKEKYLKAGIFPNLPEFMYYGDMEYNDFLTQYELEWLEQFGLFLNQSELNNYFSGTHKFEKKQSSYRDELYAGVDFATGVNQDDTSVSVFKKDGNVKRKVFGCSWGDLPLPDQKRELVNLFGRGGRFRCKCILGDVGGNGEAIITELNSEGMPIYGVHFGSTDKEVRMVSKNMKTSMFDDFKQGLQNNKILHYTVDDTDEQEIYMEHKKTRREWESLEVEVRTDTVNKKIQAIESEHDDIPSSDILGCRAFNVSPDIKGKQQVMLHRIPHAVSQGSPYK